MVAIAGRGWRLAPTLIGFIDEVDEMFPGRSRLSDGSIGDLAHSARVSDHNPEDDPADRDLTRWVTAIDITKDLDHGVHPWMIFERLRVARDPRLAGNGYCIAEGLAFYGYATRTRPAWTWVRYGGSNRHDKHGHCSCANTAAARNDMRTWLYQEELDVSLTDQDKKWLQATVRSECNAAVVEVLRAEEFDVDDADEALTGLAGAVAANRRTARAAATLGLVQLGKTLPEAQAEVKRVEDTANALVRV